MPDTPLTDPLRDIRKISLLSLSAAALLIGGAAAWGASADLASAVIAPAQIVVETNLQRVQHPTGGVIAEIRAKDGDKVKAGEIVVRLDDTTTRANLGMVDNQLNQLTVREARLAAERDGLADFALPAGLADRAEDPAIARIDTGERSLFNARRAALTGQKSQLTERVSQIREEISGLTAQAESKREQSRLIRMELDGLRSLYRKNLVPLSRVTALERDVAGLLGEEGQLVAETARAKGRITETELQIIQLDQDHRKEVTAELREAETQIADLTERRIAALDQLQRVDIRAPQDGIVHQKSVHTAGGVIGPGEQMMLIVPEHGGLVVEARIEPQLIDRLEGGQDVTLRFSAFNSAKMPDVFGVLSRVSADISRDEKTGLTFYTARIAIPPSELAKFAGRALVPGMPVEAFIETGSRTVFAYLLKPFHDQLERSFRYD